MTVIVKQPAPLQAKFLLVLLLYYEKLLFTIKTATYSTLISLPEE
jgi:hypothetical protein